MGKYLDILRSLPGRDGVQFQRFFAVAVAVHDVAQVKQRPDVVGVIFQNSFEKELGLVETACVDQVLGLFVKLVELEKFLFFSFLAKVVAGALEGFFKLVRPVEQHGDHHSKQDEGEDEKNHREMDGAVL